jgi:uncharacterized protein YndB with AHSA1/START domain
MPRLIVELADEVGIIMGRKSQAQPAAVFEAHVNPTAIAKWMIGSPDWTMPV